MLLEFGHRVFAVDIDEKRVAMLSKGRSPIAEPGLEEILTRGVEHGYLSSALSLEEAPEDTLAVFICVGTPTTDSGDADLRYLMEAIRGAQEYLPHAVQIIKSTVPPGTNTVLRQKFPGVSFASNPEFLRQGTSVKDTLKPSRTVIGATDPRALEVLRGLYQPFVDAGRPVVEMNEPSAEIMKYAANSLLSTKIAFINEIADLCEAVGADVDDVAMAVGLDSRIGAAFLQAGPGFGGSCFPKDTKALVAASSALGVSSTIVNAVSESNERRRATLAERVVAAASGESAELTVAVLGLTFKAGTDDLRESPAVDVVAGLVALGCDVVAYDPFEQGKLAQVAPEARAAASPYEAARDADVVVVATEWPEFAELDMEKLASLMAGADLVDLRNIIDIEAATAADLSVTPIGKPRSDPA